MRHIVPGILIMLIFNNCHQDKVQHRIINIELSGKNLEIKTGDIFLTTLNMADTLYKSFFWPVNTLNGIPVTRGYPLNPREGEPSDHPHQTGIWFNFGNVNGLDFWNNSDAIPSERKHLYGRIRSDSFHIIDNNSPDASIELFSSWMDYQGQIILNEKTVFLIAAMDSTWSITRNTSLIARAPVNFRDNKEGLFAIRLAREFQFDTGNPEFIIDSTGSSTETKIILDEGKNGMYTGSSGKKGNDTWGTSNEWVYITTFKDGDSLSVMIMDHPSNFGFPALWHARNYGLFSVNNLGRKAYRKELPEIEKNLAPAETLIFLHSIVIKDGGDFTRDEIYGLKKKFYLQD